MAKVMQLLHHAFIPELLTAINDRFPAKELSTILNYYIFL